MLKRTPLYAEHMRLGGRMATFAGWELPLWYRGVLAEHRAVRVAAGLFDVSHMGRLMVRGPGALETVQRAITNDAAALAVGQALYTPMCNPEGGILEDLIVYRTGAEEFLLIVNAANTDADRTWLEGIAGAREAEVLDRGEGEALLALQGPAAASVLGRLADVDLTPLASFHLRTGVAVAGRPCLVARTGYTGEDGFELSCAAEAAVEVWRAILADDRVTPCGLGARDTLRLEAALPLYGHELGSDVNPLEVRLATFVKFGKAEFIGREALLRAREAGPKRRLCGLALRGGAVARAGSPVVPEGVVTSGAFAPTLGRSVALALVPAELARAGTELAVVIRGAEVAAEVVRLPFYRRS